jgi:hypothetical protein
MAASQLEQRGLVGGCGNIAFSSFGKVPTSVVSWKDFPTFLICFVASFAAVFSIVLFTGF